MTADVDYTTETFEKLSPFSLRAAFVNPLFFNALQAERFFAGTLNASTICIYHIPFPQDDGWHLRRTLEKNLCRWDSKRGEVIILCNPNQHIAL